MAQNRLRQALPSLIALRHSLSTSPLLKPCISSSLSSQQQQDACSFLTSIVQSRACTSYPTVSENKVANFRWSKGSDRPTIEVVFESCDFNHWLIGMRFGDPQPTQQEMIRTYEKTVSEVLNISLEEARQRIYACATATFRRFFQAKMTKEESEKFNGVPGVAFVFPDLYVEPKYQKYGGDPYINGTITPRPPAELYEESAVQNQLNNLWEKVAADNLNYNPAQEGSYRQGVTPIPPEDWLRYNKREEESPTQNLPNNLWVWAEDAADNLNDSPAYEVVGKARTKLEI